MSKNTAGEVDVSERLDCSEEFMMPSKKVMGLCPGVAGELGVGMGNDCEPRQRVDGAAMQSLADSSPES